MERTCATSNDDLVVRRRSGQKLESEDSALQVPKKGMVFMKVIDILWISGFCSTVWRLRGPWIMVVDF